LISTHHKNVLTGGRVPKNATVQSSHLGRDK